MKIRHLLGTLLVLILSAAVAFAAVGHELDGKTFKGEVGEAGAKADPDTFIFKDGTFRSAACDQFGFDAAEYKSSSQGRTWHFTAKTVNKQGSTITWNGAVNGEKVEGTALRETSSGKKFNMIFKGTLQPKS